MTLGEVLLLLSSDKRGSIYTTLQKVSGQALFDFLKIEYINYHFLKKKTNSPDSED